MGHVVVAISYLSIVVAIVGGHRMYSYADPKGSEDAQRQIRSINRQSGIRDGESGFGVPSHSVQFDSTHHVEDFDDIPERDIQLTNFGGRISTDSFSVPHKIRQNRRNNVSGKQTFRRQSLVEQQFDPRFAESFQNREELLGFDPGVIDGMLQGFNHHPSLTPGLGFGSGNDGFNFGHVGFNIASSDSKNNHLSSTFNKGSFSEFKFLDNHGTQDPSQHGFHLSSESKNNHLSNRVNKGSFSEFQFLDNHGAQGPSQHGFQLSKNEFPLEFSTFEHGNQLHRPFLTDFGPQHSFPESSFQSASLNNLSARPSKSEFDLSTIITQGGFKPIIHPNRHDRTTRHESSKENPLSVQTDNTNLIHGNIISNTLVQSGMLEDIVFGRLQSIGKNVLSKPIRHPTGHNIDSTKSVSFTVPVSKHKAFDSFSSDPGIFPVIPKTQLEGQNVFSSDIRTFDGNTFESSHKNDKFIDDSTFHSTNGHLRTRGVNSEFSSNVRENLSGSQFVTHTPENPFGVFGN